MRRSNLILLFIVILYAFFKLYYFSFVPLFDGFSYSGETIYKAVSEPFDIFNFDTAGHTSIVYAFLLGLLQYLDLGNVYFYHLTITVFGIPSIIAFWKIARFLIPSQEQIKESLLLTMLYAFFPVISANALHVNIDYGVMVFFLYFLYFLLYKKYFRAVLFAIGLVFSKETGVVPYLTTIFCYSLFHLGIIKKGLKTIVAEITKKIYFSLPVLLLIAHFAALIHLAKTDNWFTDIIRLSPRNTGFSDLQLSRVPLAYFLGVFVINFNWILSFFSISGIFALLMGKFRKNDYVLSPISFSRFLLILGIFITTYLSLTSYKTFVNLRYFLLLYPLLLLLFYIGVEAIIAGKMLKRVIFAGVVFLFILANFRTLDPISKRIYGTFYFGSHKLLKTTSVTGECCGYGRDQLVYNLEYTHLHYLMNKLARDIKPDGNTWFAYDPVMHPLLFSFDTKTFVRTLKAKSRLTVNFFFGYDPNHYSKPKTVYYIDIPIAPPSGILESFADAYTISQKKKYDRDGYYLNVYTLELKQQ